jgi:serine protease
MPAGAGGLDSRRRSSRPARFTPKRRGDPQNELLAQLQPLPAVEEVIVEPEPLPPPATPSLTAEQGYSAAGPAGIDAAAFAGLPGGRGEDVRIIDIEYSWNRTHEDLTKAASPSAMIPNGAPHDPFLSSDHGTAVLGELVGDDNGFGITGLAPASQIGMVNAATAGCGNGCWDVPGAIRLAHTKLAPGDIMLIEQQVQGRAPPRDYVPVEWSPAAYDAIRLATQDGIIVVEPAGNGDATGGVDLDAGAYGSPFPQGKADSGAIIVGAGSGNCSAPSNGRLPVSAHGTRVDLQGWGNALPRPDTEISSAAERRTPSIRASSAARRAPRRSWQARQCCTRARIRRATARHRVRRSCAAG